VSTPPPDRLTIRRAVPDDAPALIDLMTALATETPFMVISRLDPASDMAMLRGFLAASPTLPAHLVLVGLVGATPAALVQVVGEQHPQRAHVAEIDIGVRLAWHRRGIGRAMLGAALAWARGVGLRRLQLKVMTDNHAAIALYARLGFTREGTLRRSVAVGGRDIDQEIMAVFLDP
jgi:RimJ/RimL family protein N-acetyltransferase